jgi:hypothetical protein
LPQSSAASIFLWYSFKKVNMIYPLGQLLTQINDGECERVIDLGQAGAFMGQ